MAEVDQRPSPSFSMKMTIYGISKKFPSVKNVTCEQLDQWRKDTDKRMVYLDTRPKEEFNVSHLSGAKQVDPDQEHSLESLGLTADITIVCYCSVGYRSSDVARKLFSKHKQTLTDSSDTHHGARLQTEKDCQKLDIYNLEGGLFQWANEGREIVNNSKERVSTVHPYNAFWGKLLNYDIRHHL